MCERSIKRNGDRPIRLPRSHLPDRRAENKIRTRNILLRTAIIFDLSILPIRICDFTGTLFSFFSFYFFFFHFAKNDANVIVTSLELLLLQTFMHLFKNIYRTAGRKMSKYVVIYIEEKYLLKKSPRIIIVHDNLR